MTVLKCQTRRSDYRSHRNCKDYMAVAARENTVGLDATTRTSTQMAAVSYGYYREIVQTCENAPTEYDQHDMLRALKKTRRRTWPGSARLSRGA